MMLRLTKLLPLGLMLLALAACAGNDEDEITGDRIAVLKPEQSLQADPELKNAPLELPTPYENKTWPQVMGLVDGSVGNLAVSRNPKRIWSSSIGAGGGSATHLLSRPVVNDNRVYTISAEAEVRAFDLKDGSRIWSRDLTPKDYDERQFGGGVAAVGDRLYVTTGFGSVAALDAATGTVIWQKELKSVLRSAPAVAGDRVFVETDQAQTIVLATTDGSQLWTHSGITEPSTLLGTGTPVVTADVAYIPYGSGELYAVRVQNGRTLWQQSLSGTRRQGSTLESISDIKGSPAIDSKTAYAVGNGGRMVAVDQRTGNLAWELDLGGVDTPVIVGDTIAALETQNTLVLIDRSSGRVRATYPLPRFTNEEKSKGPIYWNGPVVADSVLWVAGSNQKLFGIDAASGERIFKGDLTGSAYLAPVLAQQTLLVLTDDGRLTAFR